MDRLKLLSISVVFAGALPVAAVAQVPFKLDAASSTSPSATIGGTPSIDIITLRGGNPGAPLRFGNILPKTERVQLGARLLVADRDYAVDYASGVVYLKVAAKPGDILTVAYRYDPKPVVAPATQFAGLGAFKYQLVPGGLSVMMGFGMTERAADGSVMSSNVFGFDSGGMKLGNGKLSGVFLYGQRTRNDVSAGLRMDPNAKPGDALTDEGDSRLLIQNYQSNMLGGQASIDYQDVSQNFASFGALAGNGYDAQAIQRLQAERGMTRFGMAFKDLKFGGLGLSNSFRNVKDANGSIEWRSFGVNTNGLKLNYSSQKVDQGFQRFKDLAEADREQLMKERGMSRQNFSGEFAQKASKLSFSSASIEDDLGGNSIARREIALDTSRIKFSIGDQEVDRNFNRWDNILGDEKARYGREAGLNRQWSTLQTTLFGSNVPITFNQSVLRDSAGGSFRAQDVAVKGSSWSLQHVSREADSNFARLNGMQDPEMDSHIKSIANMYDPNIATRPEDRQFFLRTQGLAREYTSAQSQLFKGWNVAFSRLNLEGQNDGGKVETATLHGRGVSVNYRRQELGKQFGELTSLMEFERQRLGTIAGLERTDLGMNLSLGGAKRLSINKMAAQVDGAEAQRTSVAYSDRKIDVSVNTREVDPTMTVANQLVESDTERALLQKLRGFSERDVKVKWEILPQLRLDMFQYDASSDSTGQNERLSQTVLDWAPTKNTQINYTKFEQNSEDPVAKLFANAIERITVNQNLGRYGKVKLVDERVSFDGKNATDPSRHTQFLAYETKIDAKTSVKTEQTRTQYDNGDKENISANTISTAITKKVGLSVTDVNIDRKGEDRDEKRRNYGFWWDIGNNLRVSYGYARHLAGETNGEMTSTLSVGANAGGQTADKVNTVQQGRVGDLMLGGGYGVNEWDSQADRTQSFSNVSLSTAKAMNLGFIRDVQFSFGYDTAADYSLWLRENRSLGFNGKLLNGHNIGFEYRSQMTPMGDRGIDRTFKFQTAASPKNWLQASVFYKARTLPNDEQVMIRDLSLSVRPTANVTLTNQMRTNPEVARGDALLGSITAADRSNKWMLDFKRNANFTIGGSWEELINDSTNAMVRTGGLNLKLFEGKGSPLSIFYGIETQDGNMARRVTHRYHIQYSQRPGPNQQLSFFAGNVSYDHSILDGAERNNITLRADYQIRF